MSPPRIMFDDGSRIMDDGAPQSSSSNESQQPSSSLTSSSPSSARGALSLETYYEIDRVAKEVVDKLDWSTNASRGVLLHQIISSTSSTTTTTATTNITIAADNIHCDTIDGATNKPKSNDGTTASIVQDEDGFLCRIALQFPDELLGDGPEVSWLMEVAIVNAYKEKLTTAKSTSSSSSLSSSSSVVVPLEKNLAEQVEQHVAQTPLLFILGDTTYGACCPDEVSANHLNANLIVHYGYACLSPTEAVPVVYAFGVSTVGSCCIPVGSRCVEEEEDATNVNAVWKECVQLVEKETGSTGDQSAMEVDKSLDEAMAQMSTSSSNEEQSKKLLILYEVKYHHAMEELRMEFENTGRFQVVVGSIPKQQLSGSATRRLEGMTKGGGGGCGNGGGSGGGGCGDGGCGSGATVAAPVVPRATANGCCDSINGGAQADQSCATKDNSSCCAKGGENANCNSASDTKDATTPDQRVVIEKQYIPRTIGGLEIPNDLNLSQYALLYIGDDLNIASHEPTAPTRLLHILLRCTSPTDGPPSLLSYSPQHRTLTPNLLDAPLSPTDSTSLSTALSRILRRRYFLLNKTKLATTIAILIGTTSNSYSFRRLLSRTRSRIQSTGRTAYTVSVGKLSSSPSKLTNFAEIDAFVLIACGESVARFWRMEREEMIVPVLTPLELDVALGYREWDGRYSCDFGDLIRWDEEDGVFVEDGYGDDDGGCDDLVAKEAAKGNDGNGSDDNDDDDDDDSDDEPFFSMISGRYEQSRTASSKHNKTDLQALPGQGKIVEYRSEAAEFLKRREYRGLEANVGETEAKAAVLGQVGIASNYGEKL